MNRLHQTVYAVCIVFLIVLVFNTGAVCFPIWEFTDNKENISETLRIEAFAGMLPLYQYSFYQPVREEAPESETVLQLVIHAQEDYLGTRDQLLADENYSEIKEHLLAEENGQAALSQEDTDGTGHGTEVGDGIGDRMENGTEAGDGSSGTSGEGENGTVNETDMQAGILAEIEINDGATGIAAGIGGVTEGGVTESGATGSGQILGFNPALPQIEYDLNQFREQSALLTEFYAVDATTAVTGNAITLDSLLQFDMTVDSSQGSENKPQILIYHTHSQEGFADSIAGDKSTTIMAAGRKLAEVLKAYGFHVLYHEGEYDTQIRDNAYAYAAPAIEELLAEYPSIEVIIDLHRDEVRDDTKLVTTINGKPTAKFMFFNGLSYNNKLGEITYLPNPNLKENLAFSFQAQVLANEYYPGITRRIYLRSYRYNMHYRGKSMLIELGAQTNTVEEILNAVDPLGHVLAMTLQGSCTRQE